jgi:hypothetical protein
VTKVWHRQHPNVLAAVRRDVDVFYPDLQWSLGPQDRYFLRGPFTVGDEEGTLDRFDIEVEFPDSYSWHVPIVREIGGQIPRDAAHHVWGDRACLWAPGERHLYWPHGSTFRQFLDGPVRSWFIGQVHVRANQPWPYGEHHHNDAGVFEAFAELLGLSDRGTICRCIQLLLKAEPKGHHECPCGSGKRLRECHGQMLRELHTRIERDELLMARAILAQCRTWKLDAASE